MTTDLMEVFSLEEGDTIIVQGEQYVIHDIETLDKYSTSLLVFDEEGFAKTINVLDTDKVRVVCEVAHDVL